MKIKVEERSEERLLLFVMKKYDREGEEVEKGGINT